MSARRALDRIYSGSLVLAGVFLIAIFSLMISEAVLRKLGGYVPGATELIEWCCAAAGFLALPATFKRGDMVRVGGLVDALAPVWRKAVLLLCLVLATLFSAALVYAAGKYMWDGWRSDETTQGMLEIAVWVPQSSFLIGALLLLVAVIDETLLTWRAPAAELRAEKPLSVADTALH